MNTAVQLECAPAFVNRRRRRAGTPRQRGIEYEAKAQQYLVHEYGKAYQQGPWFSYTDDEEKLKFCQPDGLLLSPHKNLITIIEIKLNHTMDAWFQLRELYLPVVAKLFPTWEIATCEVVRWFNGDMSGPVPLQLIRYVDLARPNQFAVHIWNEQ